MQNRICSKIFDPCFILNLVSLRPYTSPSPVPRTSCSSAVQCPGQQVALATGRRCGTKGQPDICDIWQLGAVQDSEAFGTSSHRLTWAHQELKSKACFSQQCPTVDHHHHKVIVTCGHPRSMSWCLLFYLKPVALPWPCLLNL